MLDRSALDLKGPWLPTGFQVTKVRHPRKRVPRWAGSASSLALYVLGTEGRFRFKVAYLYWIVGMSAREIAESTKKSQKSIRNILYKLLRKGLPVGVGTNPL